MEVLYQKHARDQLLQNVFPSDKHVAINQEIGAYWDHEEQQHGARKIEEIPISLGGSLSQSLLQLGDSDQILQTAQTLTAVSQGSIRATAVLSPEEDWKDIHGTLLCYQLVSNNSYRKM